MTTLYINNFEFKNKNFILLLRIKKRIRMIKIPWGYHLIMDVFGCNSSKIQCKKVIYQFSKRLVNDIDMKAFGEPIIVRFGDGNKLGFTLVQLIETSNITAHFCEETNNAFIDVFSCKPFQIKPVTKAIFETFEAKKIDTSFIIRQGSPILK
jgi:S-adenosylmethionine/arginine decarboxylase-like enzyme